MTTPYWRLFPLIVVAATATGCSTLLSVPSGSTASLAADTGQTAATTRPDCRSPSAPYLVRDLTRPWRERVYLLPDGSRCRPGGVL